MANSEPIYTIVQVATGGPVSMLPSDKRWSDHLLTLVYLVVFVLLSTFIATLNMLMSPEPIESYYQRQQAQANQAELCQTLMVDGAWFDSEMGICRLREKGEVVRR